MKTKVIVKIDKGSMTSGHSKQNQSCFMGINDHHSSKAVKKKKKRAFLPSCLRQCWYRWFLSHDLLDYSGKVELPKPFFFTLVVCFPYSANMLGK